MNRVFIVLAFVVFGLCGPVCAQDTAPDKNENPMMAAVKEVKEHLYFPGSMWTANGTLSPVETDNFASMTHAEQGVAYRHAEVYFLTTFQYDTKAYDWDRRGMIGIGSRYTFVLPHGMVRAGVAYVSEKRFVSEHKTSALTASVDAWFG